MSTKTEASPDGRIKVTFAPSVGSSGEGADDHDNEMMFRGFKVLALIGTGSHSECYLVQKPSSSMKYVMKVGPATSLGVLCSTCEKGMHGNGVTLITLRCPKSECVWVVWTYEHISQYFGTAGVLRQLTKKSNPVLAVLQSAASFCDAIVSVASIGFSMLQRYVCVQI